MMERILNNKNLLRFRVIIERDRGDRAIRLALLQNGLRGINDEKVRAVRTVAERALRDDAGLLRHINVAHLDELSGQKLDDFTKRIVSDFMTGRKGWINGSANRQLLRAPLDDFAKRRPKKRRSLLTRFRLRSARARMTSL